jgi:alpha-glucosidase (family GH31 glycosyl hydrolase)
MPAQALAAVATLLSFAPHGNRIDLQLDRGAAQILFLTGESFHFRRALEGAPPAAVLPESDAPVTLQMDDTPGALLLRTKFLEVAIEKHGVLLRVRRADGEPLTADLTEPKPDGAGVSWDRQAPPGVRFYGLGPRTDLTFDLRGRSVQAEIPFLLSTSGYGEFYAGSGQFHFDFTANGRYRIQAPQVDYYFYYGTSPKQIFEARKDGPTTALLPSGTAPGTWETLRSELLRLVHGAMSGNLYPSFDLGTYDQAPPELQQRARQIGSLVQKVTPGTLGLSGFRKQLNSFFDIYDIEVRDHGHPTWHPLPFQFPDDPECARHADEFMLGDEMLIAPIYQPSGTRQAYLPQGIWTNLETNQVSQGRQTIAVETAALPVFARNGAIVPLDSAAGMALHYFPSLGGEFFLIEAETGEYTQIHAAPAADAMRLEIESKKDRDYQWVVHNIEKPAAVGFEDRTYQPASSSQALTDGHWYYDASQKNLQVRVKVKAGEDRIINLTW